jgi:hypothetical protein
VAIDEQLRHGESHFNQFVSSCFFYRVGQAHELCIFYYKNNDFSFFHLSGPFLSSELELSPLGNQMLNSVNKMASPRILKSHMPFYLLHPKLLDTSKVS